MKTVAEVLEFLRAEIVRLESIGSYGDDVDYLEFLIKKIEGAA